MRPRGRRGGRRLSARAGGAGSALIALGTQAARTLGRRIRRRAPDRARPRRAPSAPPDRRASWSIASSIASRRDANERSLSSSRSKSELDARLSAPIAWRWATAARSPAPRARASAAADEGIFGDGLRELGECLLPACLDPTVMRSVNLAKPYGTRLQACLQPADGNSSWLHLTHNTFRVAPCGRFAVRRLAVAHPRPNG